MVLIRTLFFCLLVFLPASAIRNQGLPVEEFNKKDMTWFKSNPANRTARSLLHKLNHPIKAYELSFDQALYFAKFAEARENKRFLRLTKEELDLLFQEGVAVSCPAVTIPFLARLKDSDDFKIYGKDYKSKAQITLNKVVDSLIKSQFKYNGQYTGWAEYCANAKPGEGLVSAKATATLINALEEAGELNDLLKERIAAAKLWLKTVNQSGYVWNPERRSLEKDKRKKHLWARFYDAKNKPVPYKNNLKQSYGTWACGIFDCSEDRFNVLFIAIDDMNDMIKLLSPDVLTQTPNLDKFATKATVFTEAYTSSSQCNPSRFSVLTGLNPHEHRVFCNNSKTKKIAKKQKFLMDYFRDYGYKAIGINKIFHGTQNIARAWDKYYDYRGIDSGNHYSPGVKWSVDDEFDNNGDGKAAEKAAEILSQKFREPTFLAIGFYSPHPPWNYARKYFDLYPLDKIKVPEQPFYDLYDVPKSGTVLANQGLMGPWEAYHEQVVDTGKWKQALQAYMAGLTRVDNELGKVIDALYQGPNAENTIVVVWSDHGFHLGEKQHWKKHALWQKTTHVPFLIAEPGQKQGQVCNQVVSLLDIYPTLVDMAALPPRKTLQGHSLKPLLDNPEHKWNHFALTTMRNGNYSIRKKRWRYTKYHDGSEELYDRRFDPNEFYNLTHLKELGAIKEDLEKLMPEKKELSEEEEIRCGNAEDQ